jgi:hypothetical protein
MGERKYDGLDNCLGDKRIGVCCGCWDFAVCPSDLEAGGWKTFHKRKKS